MRIIVDTREKKPMFPGTPQTLSVGDYTTQKLKNKFHVERKSLLDLYQTLTAGNSRFKHELFRAAYHRIKIVVVVEGTHDDFINKRFPKGDERKFSTAGLQKMIKTFEKKYYLKFYWNPNRVTATKLVIKLLKEAEG